MAVSDSDGWASDDLCPSLMTVADSSDGEDYEDEVSGTAAGLEAHVAEFLASLRRE